MRGRSRNAEVPSLGVFYFGAKSNPTTRSTETNEPPRFQTLGRDTAVHLATHTKCYVLSTIEVIALWVTAWQ